MFKGRKNHNINFDSNAFYSLLPLLQIIKINKAYTQAASLNRCVGEKIEFRAHNLGDSPWHSGHESFYDFKV